MLLRTLAFASATLLWAAPCSAETFYVAGNSASNSCTAQAPCQTLNYALSKAHAGDTIVCVSPPLTNKLSITISITIDCAGARAQVRDESFLIDNSTTFVGIIINVPGDSNDLNRTVRLRGFTIDGSRTLINSGSQAIYYDRGIDIISAAAVYIEDSIISNVSQQAIYDHRTGGQTKLFVKDSVISGARRAGILAASAATGITVLDNVSLVNNAYGIAAASGNNVVINRSVISGNSTAGIEADGGAKISVENSTISHNTTGVQAFGAVRLSDNRIDFSNTAVQGATTSGGSNKFFGNGAVGTTPTLATGAPADVFN